MLITTNRILFTISVFLLLLSLGACKKENVACTNIDISFDLKHDIDGNTRIINIRGGQGPYEYGILNDPMFVGIGKGKALYQSDSLFTNLIEGENYTFVVKDNNGCVSTDKSAIVGQCEGIEIDFNFINKENGSIEILDPSSDYYSYRDDTYEYAVVSGDAYPVYQSSNIITGLIVDSTYTFYVRNQNGCESWQIATILHTFTDSRDGEVYPMITIGTQTWMAENLRYAATGSYLSNEHNIYGRYYSWHQANIACPNGWHLPSDTEWNTMQVALGMNAANTSIEGIQSSTIGKQLKSMAYWVLEGNGTNSSGFNAYPAGFYHYSFSSINTKAYFWTATGHNYYSSYGWARQIDSNDDIQRIFDEKTYQYPCRCVKD